MGVGVVWHIDEFSHFFYKAPPLYINIITKKPWKNVVRRLRYCHWCVMLCLIFIGHLEMAQFAQFIFFSKKGGQGDQKMIFLKKYFQNWKGLQKLDTKHVLHSPWTVKDLTNVFKKLKRSKAEILWDCVTKSLKKM